MRKELSKRGYVRLGPLRVSYSKKSLYKALSWRAVSVSVASVLNYWFLKDVGKAGKLTLLGAAVGLVLYYGHERLWAVARQRRWVNF